MRVLTLDLGTSATKAVLWAGSDVVARARAPISTVHPRPGWAEQDPSDWWRSVADVCAEVRADDPETYARLDAVGFAAARETFALFDDDLAPVRAGVLWSDQRAADVVDELGDADETRARTGVVANSACCAAKMLWVAKHEPDVVASARWLLSPRDWVLAQVTGDVVTEPTLESRTGLSSLERCERTGPVVARVGDRLPRVVPSTSTFRAAGAGAPELGLPHDTVVVPGAGDRACEVLGTGATPDVPMVSWGTTANVSVPHPGPVDVLPRVAAVSRGANGGFVVEAGLSASGAALGWLASLTGRPHDDLLAAATTESQPGARGVVALPWLNGARGPFWQPDAHAAFAGVTAAHTAADLARAIVEAVAVDVARCVELLAHDAVAVALAGGGAAGELWRTTVSAATDLPARRRVHDDAASVGARLVVAHALGEDVTVGELNPPRDETRADPRVVDALREVRTRSNRLVPAILDLGQ
ncbi:MAG TPA: FGGY family carbohydrate kinase [Acidimicrobiia bacterium]|nr:FGGY family carbohydrate kinase [Acidimicrobiia bacterium]